GSRKFGLGLTKYPIFTTTGASGGIDQNFNRLRVTAIGTVDRTVYQNSELTDGTTDSNRDRNYNQYGGVGRVSYELKPGLQPFVEVEGDTRVHDAVTDRNGYRRDSNGGYAKAGTSFELTRLLTGEASIGWASRTYSDARLQNLGGLLTSASLIYTMTPLTTVKLNADTTISESPLAGVSGVFTRTYTAEVDHDFRRWLTAIGKFTYATYDYQGSGRSDKFSSIEGDLVYKLTRQFWVKGQLRYDTLASNVAGGSYNATVVMLGVRLQN
ncbi:outer membrane beta-barrel protein, partial [Rhodopseudomonas sp. B29]|uniref:outer membrane beta-barrel protein n=1 Tax=Rhodopseudomonas sp. B29 TaxID=95607 RepID=UPI0003B3F101